VVSRGDYVVIRGDTIPRSSAELHWKCGVCGGRLITKPYFEKVLEMRTVCSNDDSHPANSFLPKYVGTKNEKLETYQFWYKKEGGSRMSFVKDRHTENGKLLDVNKVRRTGRISLGEQKRSGGAQALPYFGFKVYDEGLAGEAVLQQVAAAIEKYTPGQDPQAPKVLTVYLPAHALELFASSVYKLAGKEGHPRCVGDGETIQFKLGPHNLLEVGDGEVRTNLNVDGAVFKAGDTIPCPGRSRTDRWNHCEKCRLQLTLDLHIAGLPYIWSLTTGDQPFYDQFFTVLELCADYIRLGAAQFLPEIPLLLRREEGVRARPTEREGQVFLSWQDMPTLSIEVHPVWKALADTNRLAVLGGAPEPPQIQAPDPRSWYDRAKDSMPERPWNTGQVLEFVTKGMDVFRRENMDTADEMAIETTVKIARGALSKVFGKSMEPADSERLVDTVLWYLFGSVTLTNAQCAVIWRWARDDAGNGVVPAHGFEQECWDVSSEANAAAQDDDYDEEDAPGDEVEIPDGYVEETPSF